MRPDNFMDEGSGIVQEYQDPNQRVSIHHDTVDERVQIRQQYENQVFKPGHNMPTKTLEQLAEEEVADAMRRQAEDQQREMEYANEDPDSEEVLERERKKAAAHDDWK